MQQEFLKSICHNGEDFSKAVLLLLATKQVNYLFVIIKEDEKPILLIGAKAKLHNRMIVEYMDFTNKKSVFVSGAGKLKLAKENCQFYDHSDMFGFASKGDIQKIISPNPSGLEVLCNLPADEPIDTRYSREKVRELAY